MIYSVFCTAHIAHIPCIALYFTLLTLQHNAYSKLCSVFCTAHIAVYCIFHALLCNLPCSYCSTMHISWFFLYFTLLNCSTLHIPRFVLYFALLTLQHIAYIPCLISVFCTAHISANYKFPALFCILHCPHCSTLHIFHALFCILHCSHCSKLQIRCFVLYFALHTLQHIAQSW